jgi:hypothetical protein
MVGVTAAVRVGVVGAYPPRPDGSTAADLVRALGRSIDVVVCAVDRLGLTYPDEVVALAAEHDPSDHRRTGRILAEHAVDAVLVCYAESIERACPGLVELAAELRARAIPYLVAVDDLVDPPALLAELTAHAVRTLVFTDAARDRALDLRLVERRRISVVPFDDPAKLGRRVRALVRNTVRRYAVPARDPYRLNLDGLDGAEGHGATVEEAGRLAVVTAGLLTLPSPTALLPPMAPPSPTALPPPLLGWAGAAVTALESELDRREAGWAVWGLGAIAECPAPPPLRRRARARRNAIAPAVPDDLDACALAVPGLVGTVPGGRRALTRLATRLHRAAVGSAGWPWFGDRLRPAAVRMPLALIAAGTALGDDGMVRAGVEALDWYAGRIGLGGADGPVRLPTPTERAVDVGATVEAFVAAYRATGRAHHARLAQRAFDWFAGANRYGVAAHDPATGTCLDGLGLGIGGRRTPVAALAYLGALLALVSVDLADVAPTLEPVAEPAGPEPAGVEPLPYAA